MIIIDGRVVDGGERVVFPREERFGRDFAFHFFDVVLVRRECFFFFGRETVEADILQPPRSGGVIKRIDRTLLNGNLSPDGRVDL